MVAIQGGDTKAVDDPSRLPKAQNKLHVASPRSGYITSIQCEEVGKANVILGYGRDSTADSLDPAVGLVLHKKVSQSVMAGEPLCTIHYNSGARLDRVRRMLEQSFQVGDAPPPESKPLVRQVVVGS